MKKIIFLIICLLLLSSCNTNDNNKIKIAQQYGIAYAPLKIMEVNNYLADETDMEVQWVKVNNTAAIREGILAGEIDIGFMAIPPFLIGVENGMDWKLASGLSYVRTALVSTKNISSIEELTSEDRIALPQLGSVQHILLAMACEKIYGDASKFDTQLVSMNHPDGFQALSSNTEITGHFTSEPYLTAELQKYNLILNDTEAFGEEFTFIVGATTKNFHDNQQEYDSFIIALNKSIDFINNNPEEASKILAEDYDLSEKEVYELLISDKTKYSSDINGVNKFNEFMLKNGYLTDMYEDVFWDE
jgi:NitT/TauT family transport system substrate-binding protein